LTHLSHTIIVINTEPASPWPDENVVDSLFNLPEQNTGKSTLFIWSLREVEQKEASSSFPDFLKKEKMIHAETRGRKGFLADSF